MIGRQEVEYSATDEIDGETLGVALHSTAAQDATTFGSYLAVSQTRKQNIIESYHLSGLLSFTALVADRSALDQRG